MYWKFSASETMNITLAETGGSGLSWPEKYEQEMLREIENAVLRITRKYTRKHECEQSNVFPARASA